MNVYVALEKLPPEERYIIVKAGKIRNMLSIIVDNSMVNEENQGLHTTNQDTFLHGFGICNMKETAARYDGECTIETPNGRFWLRLLIPIP